MRSLTDHAINGLNEYLSVEALDEPGDGGANHVYQINLRDAGQIEVLMKSDGKMTSHLINFQKGPILEAGVNGISNEALLAVVIDRLRGFQGGEYKCRENAVALTKLEEGLMWLQKRTRDRTARGVEGTSAK